MSDVTPVNVVDHHGGPAAKSRSTHMTGRIGRLRHREFRRARL